jgi:thioredoxin reductase (NADPH)
MSKPIVFLLEPSPGVAERAEQALREEFGAEFQILHEFTTDDALRRLEVLRTQGRHIALLLVAESLVGEEGCGSVDRVADWFPDARRVFYGRDETAPEPPVPGGTTFAARIPDPWTAPHVALFPVLRDLLSDWRPGAQASTPTVQVIGFQWSRQAHEIKDFLARNRVPYVWVDWERETETRRQAEAEGVEVGALPVVRFPDGITLSQPSDGQMAERIGLSTEAESPFYDLIIVGGGPAGLAAAVYGASEGLRTLIIEQEAPGGQAGQSARIENYLGFPEGLSGGDLARRAVEQADKFGVEILAARQVTGLRAEGPYRVISLDDGSELGCHTVLLSTGVAWRTLDAPGCQTLIGAGVYYGAASAEAESFRDQDVYLLGGGNSAGQAAMLLSRYARSVTMLALEETLSERMSQYLLERIENTDNIHTRPCCTIDRATGDGRLETITIRNVKTEEEETVDANGLFVFIGAAPETDWLESVVARDEQGYILCGAALNAEDGNRHGWPLRRDPFLLESSLPGVFVAGDVRAGSVKRVGAAVGEGSMAIQFIHQYLSER